MRPVPLLLVLSCLSAAPAAAADPPPVAGDPPVVFAPGPGVEPAVADFGRRAPWMKGFDFAGAAAALSQMVTFRTVSNPDRAKLDARPFEALHDWLEGAYPLLHSTLEREKLDLTLLYRWPGTDPALEPILLLEQEDVAPATGEWKYPPFSGQLADGYVWGRGALDGKVGTVAACAAVEFLLKRGYQPARTVYLALVQDGDAGGSSGARAVARQLKRKGVKLALVLDQGGCVLPGGSLRRVAAPLALVGVAEKGRVALELSVQGEGGHPALAPAETAADVLCKAVARLNAQALPPQFNAAAQGYLQRLAPHADPGRLPYLQNPSADIENADLILHSDPNLNALFRTTKATTLLAASPQEDALPRLATAVVDFRIAPGDSIAGVEEWTKAVIQDPRVAIRRLPGRNVEPSPVSDIGTESWRLVADAIHEVFGEDVLVLPNLVIAATGARCFQEEEVTREAYRLLPVLENPEDLALPHAVDERVSLENAANACAFYVKLLLEGTKQP